MPRRGEPMNADAFDHDLLLAYVEGDLAADDAARLEGQLRQDPKLAGLLAGMRADRDALRRLPREAAPDTLALPVEQRLERSMLLEPVGEPEADVAARVRPVWRRVALGVAAAAVLAFGAAVTIAVMSGGDLMDHTLALFGHEPAGKPTTDAPAVAADEADPADDADTTGDGLAMADRPDGDDAAAERRRGGGSDDAADTIDADGTRPGGALAGVIPPRARGGADPALGGDAAGEAAADATSGEALDALGAGAATAPRFFTSLTDLTDFDVADDLALRVATACASDTQRDLVTWASGNNALVLVKDRRVVGYAVPAAPPAEGWRIAQFATANLVHAFAVMHLPLCRKLHQSALFDMIDPPGGERRTVAADNPDYDEDEPVVEDITLRMTMLRDLEGVAHFIPHSQVTTVSNMTHYWSRAMLDASHKGPIGPPGSPRNGAMSAHTKQRRTVRFPTSAVRGRLCQPVAITATRGPQVRLWVRVRARVVGTPDGHRGAVAAMRWPAAVDIAVAPPGAAVDGERRVRGPSGSPRVRTRSGGRPPDRARRRDGPDAPSTRGAGRRRLPPGPSAPRDHRSYPIRGGPPGDRPGTPRPAPLRARRHSEIRDNFVQVRGWPCGVYGERC